MYNVQIKLTTFGVNNKIQAIRDYRTVTKLGLKEAKEGVDGLMMGTHDFPRSIIIKVHSLNDVQYLMNSESFHVDGYNNYPESSDINVPALVNPNNIFDLTHRAMVLATEMGNYDLVSRFAFILNILKGSFHERT